MKNLMIYAATALLVVACNEKKEEKEVTVAAPEAKTPKTNMCYLEVTQSKDNPAIRDTMSLTVNIDGNKVTGTYNWLPYEKDKKTGTYEGQLQDSIVNAVYTYSAEGTSQKEELVFKLENNQAMIKSGELEEKGVVWKLKDPANANYNMSLKQTACK